MIFSIHTDDHIKKANDIFGYAYGYKSIKQYFGTFKYRNKQLSVVENSPSAKMQMFYMEPEWYNLSNNKSFRSENFRKFYDHQYKIYGTHLESTAVWPHWVNSMNDSDEIWVGNQFAADAIISSEVETPVYVFEHGIDDIWVSKLRGQGGKVRFLHVDSGSPRKRADLVEKAFIDAFGKNKNVELTLKYHSSESDAVKSVLTLFENKNDNIKKIFQTLSQEDMVKLYHSHDVLVYPSEGEGFGFIPLQALSTGMPVISTSRWCSYDKFFKNNIIESKLGPTSHTGYLHGDVVLAEYDSLVYLMKKVYDNIDSECAFFYKQAPSIYKEYNWQKRCDVMLKSVISRVGISMFDQATDYAERMYQIKYNGNGRYIATRSTYDNSSASYVFDKNNRISMVDKKTYDSLITQDNFSEVE